LHDWHFLEETFGAVYTDRPGRPPLPTRLMAGLAILKHTFDLSDEVVCARWVENPYYQYFCGKEFFRHTLPLERSSITRWRQPHGRGAPRGLAAGEPRGRDPHRRDEAIRSQPIVDTTVQPKNITFPTDAKLVNRRARSSSNSPIGAASSCASPTNGSASSRSSCTSAMPKPYEFGVKVSVATTLKRCKGGQFAIHAKALPGNPYDGHTLAKISPAIEQLVGNQIERLHANAGYRGHNAPPDYKFRVYTSKQKRRITPQFKREMRRRAAVEPVIGHLKNEHRMDRNYLHHRTGDESVTTSASSCGGSGFYCA
jgi:hypothetical protein